ncbi:hypothetical protein [Burkholderia phage FLC9]|nr:hypothetical protein [Burkholderia phage FLC9]
MAYDYLEAYALSNIWCAPYQDRQAILELARMTPVGGAFNYFKVQNTTVNLPLAKTRMHVYSIGQVDPLLLGIVPKWTWNTFADACNKKNFICDLYANSGLQMPRTQSWYMVTENHNLIVAVPQLSRIAINLDTDPLFLRVYSNAYYRSQAATTNSSIVYVEGRTPLNSDQIIALQQDLINYQAKPGVAYAFVNGYKVSQIDPYTVNVGDVVEFVYDASIYKVVDFKMTDLRSFTSLLDIKAKYLLHYPGNVNEIDYEDDIDVFVMNPTGTGRWTGVYYHRNAGDSLRNVTHKDYSVVPAYINAFCQDQGWDPMACSLRLHIRNGGWERSLVFENNRIHELYKLSDANILGAMLGVNSNLSNFRADTLEASTYAAIMGAQVPVLDKATVESALGYNAISKVLGDTPVPTFMSSNQLVATAPYGLQAKSTGYEYDANGYLLGYASHQVGSTYVCSQTGATMVEMISGIANNALDEVYGARTTTLDPAVDYRMYVCPITNGQPTNVWTDVTGSAQYAVQNNVLTWLIDTTKFYTLVRGDRYFLGYSLDLTTTDGLLEFSLSHRQTRNGVTSNWIMQIPMGELDLWVNGKSLVERVDYFVNFPQVMIVNKSFLNVGSPTQHVVVRFTGFCNSDFTRTPQDDKGFVQWGTLSNNNRFDIRDDKVLRIQVNGKTLPRSALTFQEGTAGVSVPNALNGTPYLVRDIVVPLRGLTTTPTYTMRAASIVIDEAVSAYMSQYFDMPGNDGEDQIEQLYQIFSPFCCKLIYDMNAGTLDDPRMYQQYSDAVVRSLCAPYEYLLKMDPTQPACAVDPNFVVIQPHNLNTVIPMSIYHYRFLQRAVNLYLNGLVNLSGAVSIETYTGGT